MLNRLGLFNCWLLTCCDCFTDRILVVLGFFSDIEMAYDSVIADSDVRVIILFQFTWCCVKYFFVVDGRWQARSSYSSFASVVICLFFFIIIISWGAFTRDISLNWWILLWLLKKTSPRIHHPHYPQKPRRQEFPPLHQERGRPVWKKKKFSLWCVFLSMQISYIPFSPQD